MMAYMKKFIFLSPALLLLAFNTATAAPKSEAAALEAYKQRQQLYNMVEDDNDGFDSREEVREERQYQKSRSRFRDAVDDAGYAYQLQRQKDRDAVRNAADVYRLGRQKRKDDIQDLGEIQMNEAKAINKSWENRSKQRSTVIVK